MSKKGVNRVTLIGNLGNDPEIKFLTNGDAVCNLSIATSESWKDKSTGQPQERTEWHRVVFFRKPAEIIGEYTKKGSKLYIEGRLQTRKWQDKDGNDRYTTEIRGDQFQFLDSKGDNQGQQAAPQQQQTNAGHNQHPNGGMGQAQPQSNYNPTMDNHNQGAMGASGQHQQQSHYKPEMDNQAASKYSLGSKVEHVANNFDDFDDDIPF